MQRKIRVAILFGGKSAEHEVSLRSARTVAESLDPKKYEAVFIGIDKHGHWLPPQTSKVLLGQTSVANSQRSIGIVPAGQGALVRAEHEPKGGIDVVFPVLHGPFGEDGTVQGLLRLADVPFVGAGVLGSALGMDKDVMKRLLRDAGIPIGKFATLRTGEKLAFKNAIRMLGLPLFIKPANLGSSVGVSKVRTEAEFKKAIREAFEFDTKVIIEEFIDGREIECSVLGNEDPIASIPGEVIVHDDFYSYDAKYIDENGASLEIPAKLNAKTRKLVQEMAVRTFKALECEGMGRVDSFVTKDGRVIVNEINTIPGFTSISMYPKLWEASGISYSKLVDTLIKLAIERFDKQKKLKIAR
jgi:D-alanine-D-alanine ligase